MKKIGLHTIKALLLMALFVLLSTCELDNEFMQYPWSTLSQKQVDIATITGPSQQDYTDIQIKAFRLGGEIRIAVLDRRRDGTSMFYLLNENLETVYSKAVKDIKFDISGSSTQFFDPYSLQWHIDGSPNATVYGNNIFVISTEDNVFILDPVNNVIKGANALEQRLWTTGKGFFASFNSATGFNTKRLSINLLFDTATTQNWGIAIRPDIMSPAPLIETKRYDASISRIMMGISADQVSPSIPNFLVWKIATNCNDAVATGPFDGSSMGLTITSQLPMDPTNNQIEDTRVVSSGIIVHTSPTEDTLLGFDGAIKHRFKLSQSKDSDTKSQLCSAYVNDYDNWFIYDSEQKRIMRLRGWWL